MLVRLTTGFHPCEAIPRIMPREYGATPATACFAFIAAYRHLLPACLTSLSVSLSALGYAVNLFCAFIMHSKLVAVSHLPVMD